jgi:hypothetical protein
MSPIGSFQSAAYSAAAPTISEPTTANWISNANISSLVN